MVLKRKRTGEITATDGSKRRKRTLENTATEGKGQGRLLPQMVLKGGKGQWRILPKRVLKRKRTGEISATDGSKRRKRTRGTHGTRFK